MYNNIIKSLLAIVPLAMMVSAEQYTFSEDELIAMSQKGESFVMKADEVLKVRLEGLTIEDWPTLVAERDDLITVEDYFFHNRLTGYGYTWEITSVKAIDTKLKYTCTKGNDWTIDLRVEPAARMLSDTPVLIPCT